MIKLIIEGGGDIVKFYSTTVSSYLHFLEVRIVLENDKSIHVKRDSLSLYDNDKADYRRLILESSTLKIFKQRLKKIQKSD